MPCVLIWACETLPMRRLHSRRNVAGAAGAAQRHASPPVRRLWIGLGLGAAVLIGLIAWGYRVMIGMPGRSYRGPLPPLGKHGEELRDAIRRDVERLAGTIGGRALGRAERGLNAAAE